MSTSRDMFRKKNWQSPAQYASGVASMVAGQQTRDALITQGATTVGNALLPGAGDALGALHGLAEGALKDEDGLYKSKGAEVVSALDPITTLSNGAWGVGQMLGGHWGNVMKGRNQVLKEKIEEEKALQRQQNNQSYYGATDASAPTARTYRAGTKHVSIEGGEPVFSRPDAAGRRTLRFFDAQGATHAQGGIPYQASEGDAIVTAQDARGLQAVQAFLKGDHFAVERHVRAMPTDEQQPTAAGGKQKVKTPGVTPFRAPAVGPADLYGLEPVPDADRLRNNSASTVADVLGLPWAAPAAPVDAAAVAELFPHPEFGTATGGEGGLDRLGLLLSGAGQGVQKLFESGQARDFMSGAAQMAPAIYNLVQGISGQPEKVERRHVRAGRVEMPDLGTAQRQQNAAVLNAASGNARDLSAGSAGNLRSNQQQAWQDYLTRGGQIEAGNAQAQQQAVLANEQARQQAASTNLQLDNQYDQQDRGAREAKTRLLQQGLTDLSNLTAAKDKNRQLAARDEQMIGLLNQSTERYQLTRGADGKLGVEFKPSEAAPANLGSVTQQVTKALAGAAAAPLGAAPNTTAAVLAQTPSVVPVAGLPQTAAATKRSQARKAATLTGAGRKTRH